MIVQRLLSPDSLRKRAFSFNIGRMVTVIFSRTQFPLVSKTWKGLLESMERVTVYSILYKGASHGFLHLPCMPMPMITACGRRIFHSMIFKLSRLNALVCILPGLLLPTTA